MTYSLALYARRFYSAVVVSIVAMRLQLRKKLSFSLLGVFSMLIILSYVSSIFAFDGVEYYPLRIMSVECEVEGEDVVGVVLVEKPFSYFLVEDGNETDSIFGDTVFDLILTVMDDSKVPVYFEVFSSTVSLGNIRSLEFSFELPVDSDRFFLSAMVWRGEGVPLSRLAGETVFDA